MDGNLTNPIIWADVPDPDIIRVGDTYYMVSTTMYFSPGCPVMKSKDLVNWKIVSYVYDVLDNSESFTLQNGKHAYGQGSWAGCLRYHNGIYYVLFAANNTDKTYIFQTRSIEKGPWKKYIFEGIYHDASLLFDEDGRVYMIYGASSIKIIELTADAKAIKPGGLDKVIIEDADISGTKSIAEGSHIYKIFGMYYIFIIGWPRTGSGKRIQLCYRSDKIDGLYEGRIVLDDSMGFHNAGVAQGGIVCTPDGNFYGLLFQDREAVGRVPVLVTVKWKDGWPIFAFDGAAPGYINASEKHGGISNIVRADEFDGTCLGLQWQWNHNPDNDYWSLIKRPGWLRLENGSIARSLTDARNTLTQRSFGPRCSGFALLDVSNMQNGDFAGLAALQDYYGFVGVKMAEDKKYVVMRAAPQTKASAREQHKYKTGIPEEEIMSVPLEQDFVYLKIDFNFENAIDEAEFYYALQEGEWIKIGDILKMSYRLSHFTGYRFALFNFATLNTGGYADFDFLRIR